MKSVADAALADAPTVERCLVVRRLWADGGEVPWTKGRDVAWDEAMADAAGEPLASVRTHAEEPYMIIYTSGTTGRPKGAIHDHGGFPLKSAVDLAHCFDLQRGDVLFWFTDMGWMMGPWAVAGALLLGATLVIYEGTPDYPGPDRLWDLVERHRITHLGISPTAVRALMAHGNEPVRAHDRSSLRVLGSTGEPWNPDPWWWLFRTVGDERVPIINYSGGTEISGGIVGCTTITPIAPCSFAGPCPGMAADVVDGEGNPVRGEVGELAIRQPWPGMTQGFWRDPDRYLEAYWSRVPGLWVHGDWARIDADGFWYISGRSDDTIKVAGKRIGPAEVESAAVAHPLVVEALAVGVPDEVKGEAIVLFAVVRRQRRGRRTRCRPPSVRRWSTGWASRSSRPRSISSLRSRRRGTGRSCAAWHGRPTLGRTRATPPRSRTPPPWIPSAPCAADEPMAARRIQLIRGAAVVAVLVGVLAAPAAAVEPIVGTRLPGEPRAIELTDSAMGAISFDLDDDGVDELVAVAARADAQGLSAIQAWWVAEDGAVEPSNQVGLRRSASVDEKLAGRGGLGIDRDGMIAVGLGEPAKLLIVQRGGAPVLLVATIGTDLDADIDVPCCLTIWEVTTGGPRRDRPETGRGHATVCGRVRGRRHGRGWDR